MRRSAVLAVIFLTVAGLPWTRATGSVSPTFRAGAASANITPPLRTATADAAFRPTCGTNEDQLQTLWPGPRPYAFEEPYRDQDGDGRFTPGEPYCDADHNGRYEAPYIAGGSGQNHWPLSTDSRHPIRSQALVFESDDTRIALVVVDSIGLFNTGMDLIRRAAKQPGAAPDLAKVFVSSTHDESAPDPIGLWGPDVDGSPAAVSSGVDDYYMDFMARRTGAAIARADRRLQPAVLKLAQGHQPRNVQSCFSSYPDIDDQQLPVMQGIARRSGRVIFTLVNAQTHAETLAFSGQDAYTTMLSADWPGAMRDVLEQTYPGSVAIEMAGLIGSVETPTVYLPRSTQVVNVPGPHHESTAPNPNGCSTPYPDPPTGTAIGDPYRYLSAYGRSVAHAAIAALDHAGPVIRPAGVAGTRRSLCLEVENNLFKAAFAAGLFPTRPAYAEPSCTAGAAVRSGTAGPADRLYVRTNIGVLNVGPAQFVYTPGEMFPVGEIRGPFDQAREPFPTTCFHPPDDYYCGAPFPMTPWISARMTRPYHFHAGLGEDMIGYLFPIGNFVGAGGEVAQDPWQTYHSTKDSGANDRFGRHHSDDSESVGPHAGHRVVRAIRDLLGEHPRPAHRILPGLYLDLEGRLSDTPFAHEGFGGAAGVRVVLANGHTRDLLLGSQAAAYATFESRLDPGTRGTGLPYSVSTAGVIPQRGQVILIDVFRGARLLTPDAR